MRLRSIAGVVPIVLVGLLLTACDRSASGADAGPSSGQVDLAAHAACMRAHGIADFPDPTADGIDLSGTDIDERSPEFQAALRSCEQFDPANSTAGWEKVVPGGDCGCSDGSAYSFLVHRGDPAKVLVYLEGGGACFTARLCDPANGFYRVDAERSAPGPVGIFDLGDTRNPFAGFTIVFVPYCSADLFLGNRTTTYRSGLTIEHKGFANGTAAVEHVASAYPDATQVVVAGASAGSAAAPVYGALVADRLPDARVTVLADSSGSYPDLDPLNHWLAHNWGTADAIRALTGGDASEQWSIPGLFVLAGRHHPDVVFARHDSAYDSGQDVWFSRVGLRTRDLLSRIDANERRIERAGVDLHSFTAPGHDHVALNDQRFYSETVDGVGLADWVRRLIAGEQVGDVHCLACGGPSR